MDVTRGSWPSCLASFWSSFASSWRSSKTPASGRMSGPRVCCCQSRAAMRRTLCSGGRSGSCL
eukprot:261741-Lingulodinium_polyedra.AAC.1